jgi:UDP-N-acetylglucosamine 2-epimerase
MSRKTRIVTIVGARPQYIKLASLHRELSQLAIDHRVINTGQHYDDSMAGVFFKELQLPLPIVNLGVGSGDAGTMTARILDGCTGALKKLSPNLVVVIGDTNSTLGGALAAAQLRLPLAHIEAGLRCFDMTVPEELNRVVTDHVANFRFCPTPQSLQNLRSEGINRGAYLTGDILYDIISLAKPDRQRRADFLRKYQLKQGEFFLVTIHRADSVDKKENLATLVRMLHSLHQDILFPLHPRTRKRLIDFGLFRSFKNSRHIRIIDPLGYRDSLAAVMTSRMVLTDSGGLQREAYFLKIPTLLLRDVTEWVEINRNGGSKIVGFDIDKLSRGVKGKGFRFDNRSICRIGASRRIAERLVDLAD